MTTIIMTATTIITTITAHGHGLKTLPRRGKCNRCRLRSDKAARPDKVHAVAAKNLVASEGQKISSLKGHPRLQRRWTTAYVFQGVHMMLEGRSSAKVEGRRAAGERAALSSSAAELPEAKKSANGFLRGCITT